MSEVPKEPQGGNGKPKRKRRKRAKKYSHFFLYLPAKGGRTLIKRVKEAAEAEGVSPSKYIRKAIKERLEEQNADLGEQQT